MNLQHLEKTANFWQDFVVNPFNTVKGWAKEDIADLVDKSRGLYRKYIWDDTPGGFSEIQQMLAGSEYRKLKSGPPVTVRRPDGTTYVTQRTPQNILDNAAKPFSWNSQDPRTGEPLWRTRMNKELRDAEIAHFNESHRRYDITGKSSDNPYSLESIIRRNKKFRDIQDKWRSKALKDEGLK